MGSERLIILVPDDTDGADSVYWQNFVQRVRDAIERDGLRAVVVVGVRQRPEATR